MYPATNVSAERRTTATRSTRPSASTSRSLCSAWPRAGADAEPSGKTPGAQPCTGRACLATCGAFDSRLLGSGLSVLPRPAGGASKTRAPK